MISLLDIHKRNKRFHDICKNTHDSTLSDLIITLKQSGHHMTLSRWVTLFISSLHNFDIEAYKLYDRAHRLYDAALLRRCYTLHASTLYWLIIFNILSKFNLSLKVHKGLELINLKLSLVSWYLLGLPWLNLCFSLTPTICESLALFFASFRCVNLIRLFSAIIL